MKNPILALGLLLTLGSTAIAADTHKTGYDRPAPEQKQSDGHEHLVYWATFFDAMSVDMQDLADAHDTAQFKAKKPKNPLATQARR